eukprot:scaffold3.g6716.t1
MSGADVQELGRDAVETMQAALKALRESNDRSAPQPSRQQLQAVVALLKTEAAKTGLYFHERSSPPSPAEVEPLLCAFQNAVALVCMLYTGLTASAGPSLRAAALAAATQLVEACAGLVRGAAVEAVPEQQLLLLSGLALEVCDAAGRAPLDNRTAIGRALTAGLKQLADAAAELADAADEGAAAAGEGGAGAAAAAAQLAGLSVSDVEGDGSVEQGAASVAQSAGQNGVAVGAAGAPEEEEEEGEEEETPSAEQVALVRAAQVLLARAAALIKALVRVLLAAPADLPGGACDGWESLLFHVRALGAAADDLAAGVYCEDADEVRSAAGAVVAGAELLADETPDATEEQAAALGAALREVQAAHAALLAIAEPGAGEAAEAEGED